MGKLLSTALYNWKIVFQMSNSSVILVSIGTLHIKPFSATGCFGTIYTSTLVDNNWTAVQIEPYQPTIYLYVVYSFWTRLSAWTVAAPIPAIPVIKITIFLHASFFSVYEHGTGWGLDGDQNMDLNNRAWPMVQRHYESSDCSIC